MQEGDHERQQTNVKQRQMKIMDFPSMQHMMSPWKEMGSMEGQSDPQKKRKDKKAMSDDEEDKPESTKGEGEGKITESKEKM